MKTENTEIDDAAEATHISYGCDDEEQIVTARCAIRTRYEGPTDFKGSRIVASRNVLAGMSHPNFRAKTVIVGYDYELDSLSNHAAAAKAHLNKHNTHETKLDPEALCFNDDYFWSWQITGPLKNTIGEK